MSLEELFQGGRDAEDLGGYPGCVHMAGYPCAQAMLPAYPTPWIAFTTSQTSRMLQGVNNASAPGFAVVIHTLVVAHKG